MILNKENLDKCLNQYVVILKKLYKENLLKVILFGSYARGEANEDSDIDVFVIIEGNENYVEKYYDKLLENTFDFMFDNSFDIDIQVIAKSNEYYNCFKNVEMLYRNIEREGIVYYEK